MILSILSNVPMHPDLATLTAIGGVMPVGTSAVAPADLLVVCADGQTLAIKYWRPGDLLHAIRQNQYEPTLVALRARAPWCYLLVGGIVTANADGKIRDGDTITGWRWEAYQGALLTAHELGVGVVHLQAADQVPAAVEQFARRRRGPVKAQPLREGLWYSPAEQILLALPGIGEARAEQLLTYCGSAAGALQALTDDAAAVPGIGPKTRQEARRALGLTDGEALARYATTPASKAA